MERASLTHEAHVPGPTAMLNHVAQKPTVNRDLLHCSSAPRRSICLLNKSHFMIYWGWNATEVGCKSTIVHYSSCREGYSLTNAHLIHYLIHLNLRGVWDFIYNTPRNPMVPAHTAHSRDVWLSEPCLALCLQLSLVSDGAVFGGVTLISYQQSMDWNQ